MSAASDDRDAHGASHRSSGIDFDAKLSSVLGGRTANAFQRAFGMLTVADLLTHYPRRYAKRGELTAIDELPLDENVTIIAEVLSVTERSMKSRRGSIVEAKISDGRGILTLTFFNQGWRAKQLLPHSRGIFAGKISAYKGARQLAHPDYQLFSDDPDAPITDASALVWATAPIPIYPAAGGVTSWQVQHSVRLVLDQLGPVDDPVPPSVRTLLGHVSYRRALDLIHLPENDTDWRRARDALRFQEAFVLQAALLQQRWLMREESTRPRVATTGGYLERFDALLRFTRTGDQETVGEEITRDLESSTPMNRLLQGEVGSGKTLVALRAMLAVADAGGQSALLAPTEVLAAQHLRSIAAMLGPDLSAALMPTLVTGQLPAAERRKALLRAVTGQARIVVGTHALLGDAVSFYDLGLVVVDEQHRFGVDQREALRLKGETPPHVLVLTATPIPRTVAMTVFGDLDISTIAELPAGRVPIESFVVPLAEHPTWERRIWERAAEEIAAGRQVFVVCPAISPKALEEGDEATADAASSRPPASVETVFASVRENPLLTDARVAALHGRMSSDEKDAVMRAFSAGDLDLVVATTVIEVGVDVPNASAMVVLDADRFGVSQLHQLRGRVGRGQHPGLCLFVTAAEQGSVARERVDAVAATLDGFELAQVDLELRREGDVLGSNQSGGRSSLRLLRVVQDAEIIAQAREAASHLVQADPTLIAYPALLAALARRLDPSEREFLGKN